ncbi:MAG: class I adenylate-forming enzyme family protein [Myxococcota bacterium]
MPESVAARITAARQALTAEGAPFEIVPTEVRGVPLRSYKHAPPDLRAIWLATQAHAENDYLVYGTERWTYADAHRDVGRIAAWLAERGVGRGDSVAIAMRNFPEWLLAYWACVSTGIRVIGMNAWWVADEMRYALEDADPSVLILDQERLDRFEAIRGDYPQTTVVGVRLARPTDGVVSWSELVATEGTLPDVAIDPDDDACIFYTSGTTGRPKGAQLTHRGCAHNLMNMAFWDTCLKTSGALGAPGPAKTDAPTIQAASLVTTPLFHVTANNCVAHGATASGGKLVMMYKWDAGEALELIEAEKITGMSGVPTMARELVQHPDFEKTDTSTLKSLGGGGAPLQPDLVEKIDKTAKSARPGTGYGMTETCGVITMTSADAFVERPTSCGPALPTFETRLVDDDGNDVPEGQPGELWVRGAPVIKGYLNRPDATAETITDGWLHTGDVAKIDEEGFIHIVDRKKDMVLRGGENVYCAEVEAAIFDHDDVAECAVFGVPDDRLGEEVGAAIYLKPGGTVTPDDLRAHAGAKIAAHKIPRYIWIVPDQLPRNASGKFLKRELRETLSLSDAS